MPNVPLLGEGHIKLLVVGFGTHRKLLHQIITFRLLLTSYRLPSGTPDYLFRSYSFVMSQKKHKSSKRSLLRFRRKHIAASYSV